MRLDAIHAARAASASVIPVCADEDISGRVHGEFRLVAAEPLRRRVVRQVAPAALFIQQRALARMLGCSVSFRADLLCLEERFGADVSAATLFRILEGRRIERVLVPGCYLGGEDVQFWLRRGVKRLDGVDLNSLAARWKTIVPTLRRCYGADVHFRQAPMEQLPFADETFDAVSTSAVLEHVMNLGAIASETARVLKPGGIAWHSFGPLYFSFGADHCIAAYGDAHGYDHLLLQDEEYQARINDQAFYDAQEDPNLPFWARQSQFSFAYAREYLQRFQPHFRISHVLAKISAPGLAFRRAYPDQWRRLLAAGIAEEDLLIKGLSVILRRA